MPRWQTRGSPKGCSVMVENPPTEELFLRKRLLTVDILCAGCARFFFAALSPRGWLKALAMESLNHSHHTTTCTLGSAIPTWTFSAQSILSPPSLVHGRPLTHTHSTGDILTFPWLIFVIEAGMRKAPDLASEPTSLRVCKGRFFVI